MNNLLRLRIWPSFSPSCRLYPPGRSPLRDGVEPEAWRPRVSVPATYSSGTPRNQSRGTAGRVARGDVHLRGLATAIHETSGLANKSGVFLTGLNEVDL